MRNDIANALVQAQAIAPPAQGVMPVVPSPQQNPFALDPALEQAAASQRAPLHPLVAAVMGKLGLLNMIRNQGNAAMTAGDQIQ